jgi:hypothetical protein
MELSKVSRDAASVGPGPATFEVTIPTGACAGQELQVTTPDGQILSFPVPTSVTATDVIQVEYTPLSVVPPAFFGFTVPPGIGPGMTVQLASPDGQQLLVNMPATAYPGTSIQLQYTPLPTSVYPSVYDSGSPQELVSCPAKSGEIEFDAPPGSAISEEALGPSGLFSGADSQTTDVASSPVLLEGLNGALGRPPSSSGSWQPALPPSRSQTWWSFFGFAGVIAVLLVQVVVAFAIVTVCRCGQGDERGGLSQVCGEGGGADLHSNPLPSLSLSPSLPLSLSPSLGRRLATYFPRDCLLPPASSSSPLASKRTWSRP